VKLTKSTFWYVGLSGEELENFKEVFPYNFADLSKGFRYLGYYLKIGMHKAEEWRWLLDKIQKEMGHWLNRWFSMGGCFILLKYVLESQLVYWISVEIIPI